jgi:FKBP-type peptidyl-prolyl cis-trans isomerase 2
MKKGDIIRLDFNCYYAASGELFDTTDEALAKDKNLWHEGHTYAPRVFIIGSGSQDLPTGLELDLLHAKVGEKREVTLEAKDAYGAHNPLLVETISVRELLRLGIDPEVGAPVQRKNRTGYISGIFGGRVRVDYNHKLAGKALKYEYTVTSLADKPADKVRAVIDLHYGRADEFNVDVSGKAVSIKVPDVCKFDQSWATQKLRVVLDVREHAGLDTVSFIEEYVKKQSEEDKAEADEKPAEESPKAESHAGHDHAGHDHGDEKPAKEEKAVKAPKAKVKAAAK